MRRPALATLQACLKMIGYLADHHFGATVEELSVELNITHRQVYRYINALKGADVELTEHPRSATRRKTWRLKDRPRFARLVGRAL